MAAQGAGCRSHIFGTDRVFRASRAGGTASLRNHRREHRSRKLSASCKRLSVRIPLTIYALGTLIDNPHLAPQTMEDEEGNGSPPGASSTVVADDLSPVAQSPNKRPRRSRVSLACQRCKHRKQKVSFTVPCFNASCYKS